MPYKNKQDLYEAQKKYRQRKSHEIAELKTQAQKKLEEQMMTLLLLDSAERTQRSEAYIEKVEEYNNLTARGVKANIPREEPDRVIPEHYKPFPSMLKPFFERVTEKNCDAKRKHQIGYLISHYYHGFNKIQREGLAARARAELNRLQSEELDKRLEAAEEFFRGLNLSEGIAEDWSQRLGRFCYASKLLKDEGFDSYVTTQVCGQAFLRPNDMMDYKELMESVSFNEAGKPEYTPSNKYWTLGGLFKNNRSFVNNYGDCDWLKEWLLSEEDLCVKNEQADRQRILDIHAGARDYERCIFRSYDLLAHEGLSEEGVYAKLEPDKPLSIDKHKLKAAISGAKRLIDKEEKDRAFLERFEEKYCEKGEEPIFESIKKRGKVKVKFKVIDEKLENEK